jgi:hypothetical protein
MAQTPVNDTAFDQGVLAALRRLGHAADREPISPEAIVRIALLTALIVALLLWAGGIALNSYGVIRFRYVTEKLDVLWHVYLMFFALTGGIVAGALAGAWRLINRREARWSAAGFIAIVVLFALMVWPTPWTYRQFGCKVFQVNRFVGNWTQVTTLPACESETGRVVQHPN